MVILKSGIDVPQELIEIMSGNSNLSVEWETHPNVQHPGMDEQQDDVVPRKINQYDLPKERIVYYVVTTFKDEHGKEKKLFVVEDSSDFVERGRVYYTVHERRTSRVVDSQEEAEMMVLDVIRSFIVKGLPETPQ